MNTPKMLQATATLLLTTVTAALSTGCATETEEPARQIGQAVYVHTARDCPDDDDTRDASATRPAGYPSVGASGDVCIDANAAPEQPLGERFSTFESGDTLVAQVTLPTCLRRCEVLEEASCTIERDGNELVVHAQFDTYDIEGDGDCTLDCVRPIARCESAPLEPGDYTVVFDGASQPLAVPGTTPRCPSELVMAQDNADADAEVM